MKSPNFKTRTEVAQDVSTLYVGTFQIHSYELSQKFENEVTKLRINNKTYYATQKPRDTRTLDLYIWDPPF